MLFFCFIYDLIVKYQVLFLVFRHNHSLLKFIWLMMHKGFDTSQKAQNPKSIDKARIYMLTYRYQLNLNHKFIKNILRTFMKFATKWWLNYLSIIIIHNLTHLLLRYMFALFSFGASSCMRSWLFSCHENIYVYRGAMYILFVALRKKGSWQYYWEHLKLFSPWVLSKQLRCFLNHSTIHNSNIHVCLSLVLFSSSLNSFIFVVLFP